MQPFRKADRTVREKLLISLLLPAIVFIVFGQVAGHDFVQFDDNIYVTENGHVRAGLTLEGARWAFTNTEAFNWHPLTWLSHMADVEFFGLSPGVHHLVNIVLHAANAVVLFLVLTSMTGAVRQSGFAAALFAVHPLHVESVAWVAERKDVLSTLFLLLALWAYRRYAENANIKRYLLVAVFLALGLMAKAMLVTLPFALLLLDYWPLGRLSRESAAHRLLEKVPLLLLSAAVSIVTILAQSREGVVASLETYPLGVRTGNALVSCVEYLQKAVVPYPLAAFYPHPGASLPAWKIVGAALLLVAVTVAVIRALKSRPYLAVGWFWYLGTLVPVIGLVQAGTQGMADRYTYVPLIGLFIIAAWGFPEVVGRWRRGAQALAVAAGSILLASIVAAWFQAGYWRDSVTLFRHAIAVTPPNPLMRYDLAFVLAGQGRVEEAIAEYREALRIKPDFTGAANNLANLLFEQGKLDEAIAWYRCALRLVPEFAVAHNNLGSALLRQGKTEEALGHFREAVRLMPGYTEAKVNLAVASGIVRQKGAVSR